MNCVLQFVLAILGTATYAASAAAQSPHLRAEVFYNPHWLNHGYGKWDHSEFRVSYHGRRVSPMFSAAYQQRQEGDQFNLAATSYVVFSDAFYTTVGVSAGLESDIELFPHRRYDVAGYWKIPGLEGVVGNLGFTHFELGETDGQIISIGGLLYAGKTISIATLRLNRDGASGDWSASGQASSQWGREGERWFGVIAGGGREAYQNISAIPFDVRFTSINAGVFWQEWIARRFGLNLRYEYEHKFDAYTRHAVLLGSFVQF